MKGDICFYGEKVTVRLPENFSALRTLIGNKFYIGEEELNKLNIFVQLNNKKQLITNEGEFQAILKQKIPSILIEVEIKENSKIERKAEPSSSKDKAPLNGFSEIQNRPPFEEEPLYVHKNVQCDGCGVTPVYGTRYKCTICENFDYCEECEAKYKDIHNHPFLKIRKPEYAPVEIKCFIKDQ